MFARTRPLFLIFILPALLFLILAGSASARERPFVPTPPGGGPGIDHAPEDQKLSSGPGRPVEGSLLERWEAQREARRAAAELAVDKALADGDIGGDDIQLHAQPWALHVTLDVAENGDIYVAVGSGEVPPSIHLLR